QRLATTPELVSRRAAAADAPLWDYPVRSAPTGHTPEQTAAAQARFEVRIADVARNLGRGAAGKLQLMQLDALRAELGERWPAIAERVREIAEQVLSRRLATIDVFAPIAE